MHIKYLCYVLINLTTFRIKVDKQFSLRIHNKNELDKSLSLLPHHSHNWAYF